MLQITENNTDKGIEVNIIFNIGNGEDTDKGIFQSADHAAWYALQYRKLYLLVIFEKYVMHCKKIYLDQSHRNLLSNNQSLERCVRYCTFLQDEMLVYIADCIMKLRKDMIQILPTHHHPDFVKLTEKYKEIENFCKTIIK